jgi:glutathione peroxidase
MSTKSFFELSAASISGETLAFSQFAGKVVMCVNTASNCGFTGQYKDLEELYQQYKDRGFIVLGFPSNDFGGQEPGSNSEIKEFCSFKYRTTFPMLEKAPVKGSGKQATYKFLCDESPKEFQGDPGWNFIKFLVGKDGAVIGRFTSLISPTSKKVKAAIEAALAKA